MSPHALHRLLLASSVDVRLAVGGSYADALIFEHTTESAHLVALEVCEVDHEVIVGEVRADEVGLYPCSVPHWQFHRSVSIHDVHLGYLVITSLADGLHVCFCRGARTAIGSVALHESAVDLIDEWADEVGAQMVCLVRFASGDLYCHASFSLDAESLVDSHERLWRDVACHVYGSYSVNLLVCLLLRLLRCAVECCGSKEEEGKDDLFHCF